MCGRTVISKSADELTREFRAQAGDFSSWQPSWNIKPTQTLPAVIHSAQGGNEAIRRLEPARWSLVPSWSKELKTKFPAFNTRSDGITEKATWKGPIKTHRALIPSTGYYEWQTDPDTKKKTLHFIHADGDTLAFAGLYSWWKDHTKPEDDSDWWDDWLNLELVGDQHFVDAAVHAALPVAAGLTILAVAPLPYKGDGPELIHGVD